MLDRLSSTKLDYYAYALAAVALLYHLSRPRILEGFDFSLIWMAGVVWNAGNDPYASGLTDLYIQTFGPTSNDRIWVYPPYWKPVAMFLGQLPFANAVVVWLGFNLLCLVASAALIARNTRFSLSIPLLLLISMHATFNTLMLGQTSLIVLLGACILLRGAEAPSSWIWSGIGLAILALKPQFGMAAALYLIGRGNYRAVMLGVSVVAIATLPSLFSDGLRDWWGFFRGTSLYSHPEILINQPPDLNGMTQYISLVIPDHKFGLVLVGLLAVAAFALGRANLAVPEPFRVAGLFAMILFLAPQHSYDSVILAIPIMVLARHGMGWAMLACAVLLIRPHVIANYTGFKHPQAFGFDHALLTTVIITIVGALWVYAAWRLSRPGRESPPVPVPA